MKKYFVSMLLVIIGVLVVMSLSACSDAVHLASGDVATIVDETTGLAIEMYDDIQTIIGRSNDHELFSEWRHVFGNQTGYSDIGRESTYYFENGIHVGVSEATRSIVHISVDFRLAGDNPRFNFIGIDGESSYADVIALFGNSIYQAGECEITGAIKSYGYWIMNETQFVTFFFDSNEDVVAIILHRPLYIPIP